MENVYKLFGIFNLVFGNITLLIKMIHLAFL